MALAFDTLDATKSLRSAGIDERTAEAIVAVVQRTIDLPPTDHLATREQVEAFRSEMKIELRTTNGRIDDLRTLIFAAFGFNLAGTVGVGAFLYAVLKHA